MRRYAGRMATAAGAAAGPEVKARLVEIFEQILARNPEHDFAPTLGRVRRVMEYLGDPQHAYQVLHITGTNGKTSTARIAESLVRAYGLRTGLFTSPHLVTMLERISIDGDPISAERFIETYDDVAPYFDIVDAESMADGGPRLSFFEVLTVMALASFADAPVDVAIIEVGMGGEWDATNVADADVAVITPIGLDHQQWLGDTIAEIAATKAGIIKPGCVAVRAVQEPLAADILDERAREVGARMVRVNDEAFVVDRRAGVGGQLLTLQTPAATYGDVFLPLHGKHQAQNALLALTAVEALLGAGGSLGAEPVEQGFAEVASPGRLQLLRDSPPIVVDVAHNRHGAEALAAALADTFNFTNLVGVLAIMADKDAVGILEALEPRLSAVVLTKNTSPRCADPADLVDMAADIYGEGNVYVQASMPDAIAAAADLAEASDPTGMGTGAGVLVTGSVVTVGEAIALLSRS